MTQPALSFQVRGRGRHYPWTPTDPSGWPRNRWGSVDPEDIPPDISPRPSITNVLSVSAKPALQGWSAEQALRSLYDAGAVPLNVEQAITDHKYAYTKRARERAEAGTRAHTLAEALTLDIPLPTSISEEDAAFADSFLSFWSDHDPTPLHVEATVYGDGYAGTADLICDLDGVTTVVDWKTRAVRDDAKTAKWGALYDEGRMQLAALTLAGRVAVATDGGWDLAPNPAKAAMGVVLYPDGTFDVEEVVDLERWYDGFQGARALWHALKGPM